jgi:hypothetical protein
VVKIEIQKSKIIWAEMRRIITILLLVVAVLPRATAMSAQVESRKTSNSVAAFKQLALLVGE